MQNSLNNQLDLQIKHFLKFLYAQMQGISALFRLSIFTVLAISMLPTFSGHTLNELEQLLLPADLSPTECEGCSRLVSHLLTQLGIEHQPRVGKLITQAHILSRHCWVELLDQSGNIWRIDYRLRFWVGPNYPHVIVLPAPHHPTYLTDQAIHFTGGLLPDGVCNALLMDFDINELLSQLKQSQPG